MKTTSTRTLAFRALAVLLCCLLSPLPEFAQTAQHAGSVSALRPSAMRNTSMVKVKDPVNWNDTMKTDTGGRMRIALDDGSLLSIGTNTQMRVVRHDAKAQQSQLELTYGKLRSQVVRLTQPGSTFQVRTPTAVAGVIGTDFFLDVTPTGTRLVVYEGTVVLTPIIAGVLAESQAIRVQQGYSAEVNENGVSGPTQTPVSAQEESIAQTTIEGATNATKAGVTAGSHVLRNTLIIMGVAGAVAGAGVAVSKTGDNGTNNNNQIPAK